ncbi:MAG: hypothetical protein FGM54_11145, partial [Chitinophagaceae bacterium]|nr:hypothetical protein [Chitinophagaceae bacterium]
LQEAIRMQCADSVSKANAPLYSVYAQRNFKPIWLNKDGVCACAQLWLDQLKQIRYEGVDSTIGQAQVLDSLLRLAKQEDLLENTAFASAFELNFSQSYLATAQRLVLGSSDSVGIPKKYWHAVNDTLNAEQLFALVNFNDSVLNFQALIPQHPWYRAMRQEYRRMDSLMTTYKIPQPSHWFQTDSLGMKVATPDLYSLFDIRLQGIPDSLRATDTATFKRLVAQFQWQYGLKAHGRLDSITEAILQWPFEQQKQSIALNMERMRRFNFRFTQPFVWVNIPQMNLFVYRNDTPVYYMRTVVGRPSRPTTVIDADMKQVVISPPWTVPPTILQKDVLPGMLRSGGAYLARKGLKAVDASGKPINPGIINASNYKRYSYTQKPGYNSSLGEVKFNMPNSESVYMHDTPHREDFPKSNRALSSGCVRVHKPKEFAEFVLNDAVKYSYANIDSMCKLRKTKYIAVEKPMRVYFAYFTLGLDSTGRIQYPADIYGW